MYQIKVIVCILWSIGTQPNGISIHFKYISSNYYERRKSIGAISLIFFQGVQNMKHQYIDELSDQFYQSVKCYFPQNDLYSVTYETNV